MFIVLYKFGDALAGSMANPLYVLLGFTKIEVATIAKVYGVAATLAGVALGGIMVLRIGIFRALLVCGGLQALSNLMYAVQVWAGHDVRTLAVTIGAENLTGGMASAAFVAYLSGLCHRDFTATQYALLSSLATFGLNVLAASGGYLAQHLGWIPFFVLSTAACLPGLALLAWIMRADDPEPISPYGRSAIGEQLGAVAVEPGARRGVAGREALDQPPEAGAVVHLGQMRDLVGDDIGDDRLRGEDQPPAERQISARRAAAPAAPGVAHADPRDLAPDMGGERAGAARQLVMGEGSEMVAHPARDVRRIAAHADLAIGDGHWRRRRIEPAANAMRGPQHRHHRPFDKRHRARQRLEPGGDPMALVPEKAQAQFGRHAARQHQLDPAPGRVDAQPDPPRPRADPDRERRAEVERHRLPADLSERRFAARPRLPWRNAAKTCHFAAFSETLPRRPRDGRQKLSADREIRQAAMLA